MDQIKKIYVIDRDEINPYANLALEEFVLCNIPLDCYALYLWQNENTIVLGQNQNVYAQCNVDLAEKESVNIARRLSGGGTVFHDLGNLNYTFISREPHFSRAFNTNIIIRALKYCGAMVEESGRNDFLVKGKKISGNAYYNIGGRYYHHGTLLIHCDLERMNRLLYVDPEKWKDRGIDSVRSRVANLQDFYPSISVTGVKEAIKETFIKSFPDAKGIMASSISQIVSADYSAAYADLVDKYASKEWVFGRSIRADHETSRRFWWGDAVLHLELEGDKIRNITLDSDALETDIILKIKEVLAGRHDSLKSTICSLKEIKKEICSEREKEILNDITGLLQAVEVP